MDLDNKSDDSYEFQILESILYDKKNQKKEKEILIPIEKNAEKKRSK